MSKGNSLSFLTGMVAGAVIAVLAFTERGHEFMHEVQKKGEKFFDKATRSMEDDYDDADGFDGNFEEDTEEA